MDRSNLCDPRVAGRRDGEFGNAHADLLSGFAGGFSSSDLEQGFFEGRAAEIAGPESRVAFTHTFWSGEAAMRLLRRICTPCVSIAFRRMMGATVAVVIFVPSFIG